MIKFGKLMQHYLPIKTVGVMGTLEHMKIFAYLELLHQMMA